MVISFKNLITISAGSERLVGSKGHFNNYAKPGSHKKYRIKVGDFYKGNMKYLCFITKNVSNPKEGNSFYKNIIIYEDLNNNGLNDDCDDNIFDINLRSDVFKEMNKKEHSLSKKKVSIYPNPSKEIINLKGMELVDKNYKIIIRSSDNQIVSSSSIFDSNLNGSHMVNISYLNSGVFFISIISENEILGTFKFIKL